MKWLGAALILLCSTLYGLEQAKKLRDRPQQIRQLRVALQALEAEMLYGQTPLAQASENIAKQLEGAVGDMFACFAAKLRERKQTAMDAWREALEAVWEETALKSGEREVLHQFGATLGTMDRSQQQKQLKLAQTHLEREELEAKETQLRYEKMAKTLGVLAGLLLVILFV
ncbi:stage III sporulation protein AB [Shouchella clausii]|uniref:stage III sporulation protein SpoIIIAB n=1 Tax=Shouchella tritolerans TaxID=2979466 RepID=UPI0007872CA6|nr:stage III sporulation protein SpoIIIAB [Shouchella tritolerans]GIN11450.1 stage III sporulation protein AB [Shouchella clausii]